MSIPITDKFKPKGAGGYPLMDAEDILMPDGTRLSEFGLKIVTYDLVAMGLPNLNAEGEAVSFETDTTELTETLATNIVSIIVNIEYRGMVFTNVKATFPPNCNVATVDLLGSKAYVTLYVAEGQVVVHAALTDRLSKCTAVDNGKILQVVDGEWVAADLKTAYPLADGSTAIKPEMYHVFGVVDSLNVVLEEVDDGLAHEYLFEFIPTEAFTELTITPAPAWMAEPQYPAGKTCQVSILRGLAVMGCG